MDVDSPNSLKRCSSAPQINNLLPSTAVGVQHHLLHHTNSSNSGNHQIVPMDEGQSQHDNPSSSSSSAGIIQQQQQSGLRSAVGSNAFLQHQQQQQPGQHNPSGQQLLQQNMSGSSSTSSLQTAGTLMGHRDPPPTSFSNIFAPRARRFSASFSPLAVISNGSSSPSRSGSCTPGGPRLTPRISQLRQEECADLSNSREVNHEREIHSAIQMSQSYEDLTLVTENWSFKSGTAHNADDLANPLHVALPSIGTNYCSSPSPTSRAGLGLQYPTTSPSPTRKFVTRRSMSPCPIRPSPLSSSVKRKFDLEDNNYGSCYSPPPLKKIFTSSDRGSSPVCQTPSPSPICPSPDSSTASFENGSNNASSSGRITPKFFMSKLSSSASLSSGSQSIAGNGGGGSTPLPSALSSQHTPAGANGGNSLLSSHNALHATDSPPSSLSSSSLMMMDCGVSSSSMLADGTKQSATVSSSDGAKIDCDEDITDRGAVGLPTVSAESSEAVMEEVMKSARPLEQQELLHGGHRLSSGSSVISNTSASDNNNSESNSSLCPIVVAAAAAAFGAPGTNGASGGFLAEIAET